MFGPKYSTQESRNSGLWSSIIRLSKNRSMVSKITETSLLKVYGGSADMAGRIGQDNAGCVVDVAETHLQLRRRRATIAGDDFVKVEASR